MKSKLRKIFSGFLTGIFVCLLLPLSALALPAGLEYNSTGKVIPDNSNVRAPASLSDGEVYTYTTVTGAPFPSYDFTVNLSALGQKYRVTKTTTLSYNIVFVLDVSGSMEARANSSDTYIKARTMVDTASQVIDNLTASPNNQVAVVTFSTSSSVLGGFSDAAPHLKFGGTESSAYIYNDTNQNGTKNTGETSVNFDGGTNIQGGINHAYSLLNTASNKAAAIPVIVVLSDGVPSRYSSNYTSIPYTGTFTQDGSGDGNGTDSNEGIKAASYTIRQAMYLKNMMENLQIYTVGFETATNKLATATLNPTAANVALVTGKAPGATSLSSLLSGSYYYPDGAYTATNSVSSLRAALTNIVTQINLKTPIEETETGGVFSPASFVTMSYELGTSYVLPNSTMSVTLENTAYTMTRHGTSYTYDVSPSDPSYNAKLSKLVLTVNNSILNWQIPASVLPCNLPEPVGSEIQMLASPITLSFTVHFDENAAGLTAKTYPTANAITASFYPTGDNPFYYTAGSEVSPVQVAQNSTNTYTVTTNYAATYPWPGADQFYNRNGNGLPTLTGFGTNGGSGSIAYIANPGSVPVTGYTDSSTNSSDVMTLTYANQAVQFNGATRMTAQASFSTTDKANPAAYTVSSFSAGAASYTDARVSGVSGSNVTVTYGESGAGPRSVTFQNVSFTTETQYETTTITAKFQGYYGSSSNIQSLKLIERNGVAVNPAVTINSSNYSLDYYSGNYDYFDINLQYNGVWYNFDNVKINWTNSSSNSDTVSGTNQTAVGTVYTAANKTQYYYSTTASVSEQIVEETVNYRFVYDNAATPSTLAVQTKPPVTWQTEGAYTKNANTRIDPNGQGGFTVRQLSSGGMRLTVTTYYVENNTLYKKIAISNGQNGVNLLTGIVTQTHTTTGAIVLRDSLSASDCIPSATLASLTGTKLATANSAGVADVVLTLTISGRAQGIQNLAVTLGYTTTSAPTTFQYPLVAAKNAAGASILTGGNLPTTLPPGTYSLTYRTTAAYSNAQTKPGFYTVSLQSLSFNLPSGASRQLIASADSTPDADQRVKVILVTAAGH